MVLDGNLDTDARIVPLECGERAWEPVRTQTLRCGNDDQACQALVLRDGGALDGRGLLAHTHGMVHDLAPEAGQA